MEAILDKDWQELMAEARTIGLTPSDVRKWILANKLISDTGSTAGSRIVGRRGSAAVEICGGFGSRAVIEWNLDGSLKHFATMDRKQLLEYLMTCEGMAIE